MEKISLMCGCRMFSLQQSKAPGPNTHFLNMPYIKHTSKKCFYNKITKTWCKQFIEFVTIFLIKNMNVPLYVSEEFSEIEQYYKRSERKSVFKS